MTYDAPRSHRGLEMTANPELPAGPSGVTRFNRASQSRPGREAVLPRATRGAFLGRKSQQDERPIVPSAQLPVQEKVGLLQSHQKRGLNTANQKGELGFPLGAELSRADFKTS